MMIELGNSFLDSCIKSAEEYAEENIGLKVDIKVKELLSIQFLSGILDRFNYSLLSGEFVYKASDQKLERLQEIFDKLPLDANSLASIKNATKFYRKFIRVFNDHLNTNFSFSKKFYFIDDASRIFSSSSIDKLAQNIREHSLVDHRLASYLFEANLLLAELDSNIECSGKYLRALLRLRHAFVKGFEAEKPWSEIAMYEILKDKCHYLIYKVMHRLDVEEIIDEDIVDLEEYRLNIHELKSDIKYHLYFLEMTDDAYRNYNYKGNQLSIEGDNLSTPISKLHLYSKSIYKSKIQNTDNFSKIDRCILFSKTLQSIEKLDKDENIRKFNQIALINATFLCHKNKLKLIANEITNFIETTQINTSFSKEDINLLNSNVEAIKNKLKTCYADVTEFLEKSATEYNYRINDYYHLLLVAESVYQITQFCFLQSIRSEKLYTIAVELLDLTGISFDTSFKKKINSEGIIHKIEKKIKISRASNYLPVYSLYKDCLTKLALDETEFPLKQIFLDSSYVLPVNYNNQEKKIRELKYDFHYLYSLKTRVQYFRDSSEILNTQIENKFQESYDKVEQNLDRKVSESNISGMQILGTFTGLLALVFAFLNVVKQQENLFLGISYMLGFTLCLSIFILLLRQIVEAKSESKLGRDYLLNFANHHRIYLWFIAVFLLMFLMVLINTNT